MTRRLTGLGTRLRRARALASDASGFTLVELLISMLIMAIVMLIVTQVMAESSKTFRTQEQMIDGRNNTAAAIDMMGRLIREAVVIVPDPDANGIMDSIRVRGDWNPYDGDQLDPYENVTFTVAGGVLRKQEPGDLAPVPFADRIQSIQFTYFSPGGVLIAAPAAAPAWQLARVRIAVTTTPLSNGWPGRTYLSLVSVRKAE